MRKRIPILVVGTVTLLFLGLIYGYSVVMAPLKAQFDWSVSGMTTIFALSMIAFTVGNLVAGKLLKRHNVRFVMTVAIAFLLVGFVGSAFADGTASLPVVWLTYGIVASVGIGFVYNVIVPTVTAWFPDKTGMAQGICLMGYGLGGFVLGPVLTQLYTVVDWRIVFVAMAVVFSALVFASSVVIHMPTAEEAAELPVSRAAGDNAGNAAGTEDVPTKGLFRDPTFYFFYLWMFLLGAVGMATTGIGREFPTSLGADAVTAAFVIGFVNIGSGLGRLIGGTLLDRIGRAPFMVGTACLSIAGALIMLAAQVTGSIAVQVAGCLVTGLAWGAVIVTMAFVVRKVWGQANFAENLAVVNSYGIFAALVGSIGSGVLLQAVGSLATVLVVMACFGVVGLVDALVLNAHRSKVARLKAAHAGARAE
ncbi:MFS transporter [Caniella muris]|uniref:MFS transporter n=1 Tax=Caniella muris TaxID=2941502 RepID=UPI00203F92D4|nr:MFS transporter [Caniella muris]